MIGHDGYLLAITDDYGVCTDPDMGWVRARSEVVDLFAAPACSICGGDLVRTGRQHRAQTCPGECRREAARRKFRAFYWRKKHSA